MKKRNIKLNRKISVVIITKNEEKKLPACIRSVNWADEVVVVDTGSSDKTIEIAQKMGAKVYEFSSGSYSDWRNKGAEVVKNDWIFYVDADERVSEPLRDEVKEIVNDNSNNFSAYAIPRSNVILGKDMRHGGWWPDYVKRLIRKSDLKGWVGDLHEQPEFSGKLGYLENPLIHIKYKNLSGMVEKTNLWSASEARMLFESGHPKMVWWRFLRIMLTELWYRLILLAGFMDGTEGVIYALYQMWSRFVTYAKLWEMQINSQKDSTLS